MSKVSESDSEDVLDDSMTPPFIENCKQQFSDIKNIVRESVTDVDDEEIHRQTELLFLRLLFLRFVEEKEWLRFQGQTDYLASLFREGSIGESSFYVSRLEPLFECLTLGGAVEHNACGDVPSINLELFQKASNEPQIDFPDSVFEGLLGEDGILYAYQFTESESNTDLESTPITPEILGSIFEELMMQRGKKGAFYTPAPVVDYMCREGIKLNLEERTNIDPETIGNLIDNQYADGLSSEIADEVLDILLGLKVIDPACGSGAYLIGYLEQSILIYNTLIEYSSRKRETQYDLTLQIISNCIYGVDFDSDAILRAKCRLWLALAANTTESSRLTGLEFNLEFGDALLGPDPRIASMTDFSGVVAHADALVEMKGRIVSTEEAQLESLYSEIQSKQSTIGNILRKQKYRFNSVHFRVKFATVFLENDGFDIVLANPPYIRQENIDSEFKKELVKFYGRGDSPPTRDTSDLYCYFFVRANQLLREGGVQIFICSNSWLDTEFGADLQQYLLQNTHVISLIDSRMEKQFSDADVNTIISVIRKSIPGDTQFIMLEKEFEDSLQNQSLATTRVVSQSSLFQSALSEREEYLGQRLSLYHRAPEIYLHLTSVLNSSSKTLKEYAKVTRGSTTGNNAFFYLNKDGDETSKIEEEYLYDVLRRSSECESIRTSSSVRKLKLFSCKESKEELQGTQALKYIKKGEKEEVHLGQTCDARALWYNVNPNAQAPLLWMETMGDSHRVFQNDLDIFHSDKFYGIYPTADCPDTMKLCIWLNSTPIILHKLLVSFNSLGLGALKSPVYEVEAIPIPDLDSLDFDEAALESFLNRKINDVVSEMAMSDRLKLEKPIMKLLGISKEQENEMRQAVISLMSDRLGKASS